MRRFQFMFLSVVLFISMTFINPAAIGFTSESEPTLVTTPLFFGGVESRVASDEQVVNQVDTELLEDNYPLMITKSNVETMPAIQSIELPSNLNEQTDDRLITESSQVTADSSSLKMIDLAPPIDQPNDQPSFQPTPYEEQLKLAQYNWYNAYYDSLINEYGLTFNADEADSIYDVVQKKQALVVQYQQDLANQPDNLDISLEPISLDDEQGYRFQLKVKVRDANIPVETSIPDSISVNFTGGQSQLNSWWSISAQEVDLSPLKTPAGIVEVEVSTKLNASYDKLLLQIFSDIQYSGKSVFRQFTFDIAPKQSYEFDYQEYLQQNMLNQYNSINNYYDEVIKSYGLEFTAAETDTVYKLVPKKKAFFEQFQVLQASIGVQQIPTDEKNVYRFQVKAKIPDEYMPYIQTFPDQLNLSFSGGKSSDNTWQRTTTETIDLSPIKEPGGTVDTEISIDLNDTTYDQLLVQADAVSLEAGKLFTSSNVIALPMTTVFAEQRSADQLLNEISSLKMKYYSSDATEEEKSKLVLQIEKLAVEWKTLQTNQMTVNENRMTNLIKETASSNISSTNNDQVTKLKLAVEK